VSAAIETIQTAIAADTRRPSAGRRAARVTPAPSGNSSAIEGR
jgi:hypothetical protein